MDCKPTDFPLSQALRTARKRQGLTQEHLATRAGLSVKALSRLEHGSGNLSSFLRVLDVLHLDVVGRNLPPGTCLGDRIALLRRQRGLSQRQLASLVGVSVSALVSIETAERGRFETLQRLLTCLGAGAHLCPQGSKRTYHELVTSSVSLDWITPRALLEKLYSAIGTFDLDPCSPCRGRRAPVRARMRFTPEDDGLSLPWYGRVFVNPPYGTEIRRWVAKAHEEVAVGQARVVIALLPVRSSTLWWHTYVVGRADVLMLRGKLTFGSRFGRGVANAPFVPPPIGWTPGSG